MRIFVSSPGRSGTKFLAELVGYAAGIPSYHMAEPGNPICNGRTLRRFNNGKPDPEIEKKIAWIKAKTQNGNYFESNQLFITCFVEAVIAEFSDVAVVHLVRDPLEVARSYTNRGSFPGNARSDCRLCMQARRNMVKMPLFKNIYKRNLWEWVEVESRFHHYRSQFRCVFGLRFERINDEQTYERMFREFGVVYDVQRLQEALIEGKLDRNDNLSFKRVKQATAVTRNDRQIARRFAKQLRQTGRNFSFLRDDIYSGIAFARWLGG